MLGFLFLNLMQFYKWFTDLESAMKSEVSSVLLCHTASRSVCFDLWDSFTYSPIVDRREISTLREHSNRPHTDMR